MSLVEEVDLLRGIPLFEKMEASKLKLLAISSDRVNFRPGAVLMRQGDDADAAYVIISGKGDVVIDTPSGEIKVAEVNSGQIVGEVAILIDVPRTATVKTEEGLTALKIGKENFLRLLTGSPQVAVEIIKVLASRLENTTAQLREAVSTKNA